MNTKVLEAVVKSGDEILPILLSDRRDYLLDRPPRTGQDPMLTITTTRGRLRIRLDRYRIEGNCLYILNKPDKNGRQTRVRGRAYYSNLTEREIQTIESATERGGTTCALRS